jgi:hypothetical protein
MPPPLPPPLPDAPTSRSSRARTPTPFPPAPAPAPKPRASSREPQSVGEAFAKSLARAAGSQLGRQILRGVLGAITKR